MRYVMIQLPRIRRAAWPLSVVVLAAAARCFFSKTLDALGVRPDAHYRLLEPELLEVLVVGRPIAEA